MIPLNIECITANNYCLIFRMAADLVQRDRRGRSNSVSSVHSRLGINRRNSVQGRRRLRRNNITTPLQRSNSVRSLQRSNSQVRMPRARSNSRRALSQASRQRSVSRNRMNPNNGNQRRRPFNRSAMREKRGVPNRGALQNRLGIKRNSNPINARRNNQRANRALTNNVRNRRQMLTQNGNKRQVQNSRFSEKFRKRKFFYKEEHILMGSIT